LEALEFKSCKFKASKVLENEGGPSLDYNNNDRLTAFDPGQPG